MPHKHYKAKSRTPRGAWMKSPQSWKKKSIRQTPSRKQQQTSRVIKTKLKKQWSRGWVRKSVTTSVLVFLIFVVGGFIAVAWMSRDLPEPGGVIEREIPMSTKIYDRTGETVLFEFFSDEKRTPIKIENLPLHVKWSTIVIEDRSFYSHKGFDTKGIARAFLFNLLGRGRPGGSTITQQLIKNALLSPEKKITRKIKELVLAWQIEKKFTKDEILELYFNEIPYGSVTYGIEAASQTFFGKPAKNLTIAEAALLAALPQSPSYYSPYGPNKDILIGRQQYIIDSMYEEGYIAESEAESAKQQGLEFIPFNTSILAPHFVFYVKELLSQKYGEYTVEQGGLKVITTLDLFKQDIAQKIIDERGELNAQNFNATNAAFVAMNPKTGEILGMIGSRDFFNEEIDGEVNVALRPRQPGSSFKPIVYAAAFMKGLSPETLLFDLETTFKTVIEKDYEPKNYDLKQNGPVSIRQALGSSLNIPAVKTIYLTGVENVIDLAEKFGYTTLSDRSRFGLSLVLGGAEVKLLEHVAAYGVFARDGFYHPPVAILKVEDKDGRVLEEFKPDDLREIKVLDAQIVRQINSILTDNNARLLTFQPNNYLNMGDRPVAAKTGTTNDFRDAWTLGYTPSLVAGVWVGNNDNTEMRGKAAGGALAAPIWREFMQQVLGNTPHEEFKAPDGYYLPNKPMFNGKLTYNNPEIGSVEVHNILHYTNRFNLLGPIPENPWDDPNYTSWELPAERWVRENNIIVDIEEDIINENKEYKIQFIKPFDNSSLSQNEFPYQITVKTSQPQDIKKIDFYWLNKQDNSSELINTVTDIANNIYLSIANSPQPGSYSLYTIITDVDNKLQLDASVDIKIN